MDRVCRYQVDEGWWHSVNDVINIVFDMLISYRLSSGLLISYNINVEYNRFLVDRSEFVEDFEVVGSFF